mmetsp:Transcript_12622/g.16325  ORF Transcript_12622/g.16325 Transcript_12622/m.16325 type:complete len:203 (-) Transcript_12622:1020-1628(-)
MGLNPFNSAQKKLEKAEFDLKMAHKMMKREAKKRLAENGKSKKQVEKYMKMGQMDTARIYAESAIRQYSEHQNYTIMAARLDAVAQKVRQARATGQLSKSMQKVVNGISSVVNSMNVEKLTKTMEQFEEDNLTLEVRTEYMDASISNTVQGQTPQANVNELMQQIGDNIGLDVSAQLEDFGTIEGVPQRQKTEEDPEAEKEV